jgi:hypothetical protein
VELALVSVTVKAPLTRSVLLKVEEAFTNIPAKLEVGDNVFPPRLDSQAPDDPEPPPLPEPQALPVPEMSPLLLACRHWSVPVMELTTRFFMVASFVSNESAPK